MSRLLDYIASEAFYVSLGFELPAAAMRSLLRSLPEFALYHLDRKSRQITIFDLRRFIAQQLQRLEQEELALANASLAFLCVAFEDDSSPYAHITLSVLASAQTAELSLASRIASVCLHHRLHGDSACSG